ncbi:MAG: proton-conducting transporter membrane subunit, partial [Candidatus Limnocylindrales bacterium]
GWAGAFRQVAVVPAFVLPVVLVSGAAPHVEFPMAVLLGMALVARLGSLPLHAFPLRLSRGTSLTVVALAVSLLPAAFALLVGAWLETAPLRYVLPTEWLGPVLVTLAALTIAVAAPAMLVQDDLGALLAVHAIADLAVVLVAFGTGTGVFATIAVWLVLTALVRMAMAGVLLAIAARCRSRSLRDATGWVRAAPLLLPGLVVAMLAGIGWPGSLIWEARREILDTALLQPFATVLVAASLLTAFGYVRLVVIGLRHAPGSLRTPASRGTRLGRWTAAGIAFALACVPFALAFGGTRLAAALAAWQPFAAP